MAGLLLCLLVTEATLRLSNNFSIIPGLPSTCKARYVDQSDGVTFALFSLIVETFYHRTEEQR